MKWQLSTNPANPVALLAKANPEITHTYPVGMCVISDVAAGADAEGTTR
jgi:hypothetical protein